MPVPLYKTMPVPLYKTMPLPLYKKKDCLKKWFSSKTFFLSFFSQNLHNLAWIRIQSGPKFRIRIQIQIVCSWIQKTATNYTAILLHS